MSFHIRAIFITLAVLSALCVPASSADAQGAYTQLQVLMPGEAATPGTPSGKSGTPIAQTVGIPFTATVRACDASWNTVTSVTNQVLLSSSDASANLPASIMLLGGSADFTVTLNAAGTFTVSAQDDSDPTIPMATSASVTSFLLQGFEFARINQKNQYAGVPMSISLQAVDPNGDVVTGFSGSVRLQQITSFGVGRIVPDVVNMANGQWSGSVTMYRADQTAINRGNVNIYAVLDANPSKNGTSDPFTVHPGPFTHVQIVLPGQDPLPGSVSGVTGTPASQGAGTAFAVETYATDDYWNPLPSADVVRITSSDAGASTPVSGALTNGFAQFTVTLNTVGAQTLTISDQTNGSIQGMTSASIQVIPSAPDRFAIDPISTPQTAGIPVAVTIRAVDVGGNTIPDFAGDAVLLANTGAGSITPESITFSNGVWNGNIEFRGAGGAVSFTCSDFSSPPHTGTSNSFEVQPGSYAGMQVLLQGQTPQGGTADGFQGTPSDQNAGSAFSMTVRAVDAYWNRVPGINARVSLSSSDPFAGIPAEVNIANGESTMPITLYKAGFQTVTATDADNANIDPHTSSTVRIVPGPYARVLLIAPGEHVAPGTAEGRSGTATDQSINFSFTVTVYATDNWFNPVPGVTDVIRLTSNDPLAELPADRPMVDGVIDLTMRLSTGGFQQITAWNVTRPAMPTSTTQVRAISSGFHLEAEVSPTDVYAGESFNLTVKVTNDAGSVIQEINSTVTVTVQNATTQAPGQGVLENVEFQLLQGQRTMTETYTFAEPIVLVITDDLGNDPAVTPVINVTPGPPASVKLSSNPSWVGGNKHATVSAQVVDQFDNGVPDEPVIFELLSGTGVLTQLDSLTDVTGVARADFGSPRQPEIDRIRASSNGLFAEMDLETAFVNPNERPGHVTNYPNPFHPNEAPTTIAYKLADNATVSLRIFTLTGGLVYEERFDAGGPGGVVGLNEVVWDGRNGEGEVVATGGYIVVIQAEGNGETIHKMRRRIGVVR